MQVNVTVSPTEAFLDSGGTVIKLVSSKPSFCYSEIYIKAIKAFNSYYDKLFYGLTFNKNCYYEQKQKLYFVSHKHHAVTFIRLKQPESHDIILLKTVGYAALYGPPGNVEYHSVYALRIFRIVRFAQTIHKIMEPVSFFFFFIMKCTIATKR